MSAPEEIIDRQLAFYNARDLDGFASCYSPHVEARDFPGNNLLFSGHTALRERYGERFSNPALHADVVRRIPFGQFIIDWEHVHGIEAGRIKEAIVIYQVGEALIEKVWFVR